MSLKLVHFTLISAHVLKIHHSALVVIAILISDF